MDYDSLNIKLVIGLGNPGKRYAKTFHNAGFLFIDFLRDKFQEKFVEKPEVTSKKEYELTSIPGNDLVMLKPLSYMNNSGQVTNNFLKYNGYNPEEILIAFDDLDIMLGEWKLHKDRFPKSHNGINSIHLSTGRTDYQYLRMGIETRGKKRRLQQSGEDYVLSKIDSKQMESLDAVFEDVYNSLDLV
ncbi:hypothetical protein GF389_04350 [Candidatus Dojkabacteria bacterium]|nr:hypothetical protein [Candidatus Dojkabacteria bacterium]